MFWRAIVGAVEELMGVGSGDVLVFLSGEREIREAAEGVGGEVWGAGGGIAVVCAVEQ